MPRILIRLLLSLLVMAAGIVALFVAALALLWGLLQSFAVLLGLGFVGFAVGRWLKRPIIVRIIFGP